MERKNERVKISVDMAGKVFFYCGYVLDDSTDFILIDDEREGQIKLNKAQIISIKGLGGVK